MTVTRLRRFDLSQSPDPHGQPVDLGVVPKVFECLEAGLQMLRIDRYVGVWGRSVHGMPRRRQPVLSFLSPQPAANQLSFGYLQVTVMSMLEWTVSDSAER